MSTAMFWGIEQERALDKEKPQTNATPVAVKVDLNFSKKEGVWGAEGLGTGIRALQARGERCDVELAVGDQAFPAHQVMLASVSKAFRTFLQRLRVSGNSVEAVDDSMTGVLSISPPPAAGAPASDGAATTAPATAAPAATAAPTEAAPATEQPPAATAAAGTGTETAAAPATAAPLQQAQRLKLQVNGISRPEAVQILLSYIYYVGTGMPWEFKPSCVEVDKDVLHLARHFELSHLHEHAARWLIDGLSTLNVVERLVVCEEFSLGQLREKMMEQLAAFPDALGIVSSNPDIMKHPKIMQDLLKSVAFATTNRAAKKAEEAAPEKSEKPEKADKAEKVDKPEKQDKSEKAEKSDKPEKAEKAPDRPSAEKPPPAKKARKAGAA